MITGSSSSGGDFGHGGRGYHCGAVVMWVVVVETATMHFIDSSSHNKLSVGPFIHHAFIITAKKSTFYTYNNNIKLSKHYYTQSKQYFAI